MTQFLRSVMRFSWALALLGVKEMGSRFTPGSATPDAVPETDKGSIPTPPVVTEPASSENSQKNYSSRSYPANRGRLNVERFVVMGEGLAAGMGDFNLSSETQSTCFPALMAAQMGAKFSQALLQGPGIGGLAGFAEMPVLIPAPFQSTVLNQLPP